MVRYVVCFAFSRDKNDIVLILKNKPDWQKGKYNGIGGKMEGEEFPTDAIIREFKEETGVKLSEDDLSLYAKLTSAAGYEMYCFRAFTNDIYNCKTIEKEEIVIMALDTALTVKPLVNSCQVLIRMANDEEFEYCEITHTN